MPKTFEGLSAIVDTKKEYASIPFHSIPERNADGIFRVYYQAERLFAGLEEIRVSYLPSVILGTVEDLEEYLKSKLRDASVYIVILY